MNHPKTTIDIRPFPNNIARVLEYKPFDVNKFQLDDHKRIIRISGLAGSGKGTVSKKLSQLLDIGHLETSGILRAATWVYMNLELEHINSNTKEVFEQVKVDYINKELQIFWKGELLTNQELRSNIVQESVAVFAGDPYFRTCYYEKVCWLIQNCIHETIILDGRGFNTPYIKLAEKLGFDVLKLFFWVSDEVNYTRYRMAFLQRNNLNESDVRQETEIVIHTEFKKNMIDRNYQDYLNDTKNNLESITPDSLVIDTSNLNPDQVVELIINLI
jgi:cytidylate kinase